MNHPSRSSFSLVLPTYNEAANIERLVCSLEGAFAAAGLTDYDIVIVDDDSPDGTGAIADSLSAASGGRIRCVRRKGERGLATTVVAGWKRRTRWYWESWTPMASIHQT